MVFSFVIFEIVFLSHYVVLAGLELFVDQDDHKFPDGDLLVSALQELTLKVWATTPGPTHIVIQINPSLIKKSKINQRSSSRQKPVMVNCFNLSIKISLFYFWIPKT